MKDYTKLMKLLDIFYKLFTKFDSYSLIDDLVFKIHLTNGDMLSFWFVKCRGNFLNDGKWWSFGPSENFKCCEVLYQGDQEVVKSLRLKDEEAFDWDHQTLAEDIATLLQHVGVDWKQTLRFKWGEYYMSSHFESMCTIANLKQFKKEIEKL